jgi:hypothetical protein
LALFRQNRKMIWLPVLSGVTSAVAFLAISGAVAVPLWRAYGASPWDVFYLVPGIMVSTFVSVYFNVALAFAANEQIEGRTITVGKRSVWRGHAAEWFSAGHCWLESSEYSSRPSKAASA